MSKLHQKKDLFNNNNNININNKYNNNNNNNINNKQNEHNHPMLKVFLLFECFLAKMSLEFSECTEFKDKHKHYYYQPHYPENE